MTKRTTRPRRALTRHGLPVYTTDTTATPRRAK